LLSRKERSLEILQKVKNIKDSRDES